MLQGQGIVLKKTFGRGYLLYLFSFLENNLYALLFLTWIVNITGINTGQKFQ